MKPIFSFELPSDIEQMLRSDGVISDDDNASAVVMDLMEKLQNATAQKKGTFDLEQFYMTFKQTHLQKKRELAQISSQTTEILPSKLFGALLPQNLDESAGNTAALIQKTSPFHQQIYPAPVQMMPPPAYAVPTAAPYRCTLFPKKKDGRPMTAYQAAQILMKVVSFIAIGEALYAFNGTFYELQTEASAKRTILHNCRELVDQVGTVEIIKQILELVKIEPAILWKELKPSSRYVVFRNGILDLHTMQAAPLTSQTFDTSCLEVDCVANAQMKCPNFKKFLSEITGGNEMLTLRIWQAIGYLLTNDTDGKCFFIFQGVSNSGKSLLGRFIASLYNSDAVTSLDVNSLSDRFSMAEIVGKKLNISLDLPQGVIKNEAVSNIKQLTGGDLITTDVKYLNRIKFLNTCRLLYATNHAIRLNSPDEAFENRMVTIPFSVSIPPEQRDPHLLERFEPEKLAIVLKALLAYRDLVANNYQFAGYFPANQVVAAGSYGTPTIDVKSLVDAFVQQCCVFTDGQQGTFTSELLTAFQMFTGESGSTLSVKDFSMILQEVCGSRIRKHHWRIPGSESNAKRGYQGIRLK
ncbi:phage/plasmid primase, P4 family [Oscillospiraceae bacterium PP1C4]